MRKSLSLLFLCLPLLLIGCIDDEIRRPIASGSPEGKNSGNEMLVNLPVHMDSTNYLIHPVGEIEVRERGYYGSGSGSSGSAAFGDEIFGNFIELRFQEIDSEEFTGLTDQNLRIQSVRFLRQIFENTGKQFLLYKIVDTDTNEDQKLNSKDHKALYISGIDGSDFRRINPADQLLQDHEVLQAMNRLYFKTIEDVNRNGRLDAEEKPHYYYLELASEALKVIKFQIPNSKFQKFLKSNFQNPPS